MVRKWWNKTLAIICIGSVIVLLGGCGETELEERCFPMMAAVGASEDQVLFVLGFPSVGDTQSSIGEIQVDAAYASDFVTSKEKYESHLNKLPDYNHLKVLVIEREFLEKTDDYNKMLDYIAKTEEFPRNTYVCVVNDLEALLDLEKNLPQDMGTYLEEFLNHHGENKERILTLGDLMDEKENQNTVLYIPYIEVVENYVEISGYVNIEGKIWKESN